MRVGQNNPEAGAPRGEIEAEGEEVGGGTGGGGSAVAILNDGAPAGQVAEQWNMTVGGVAQQPASNPADGHRCYTDGYNDSYTGGYTESRLHRVTVTRSATSTRVHGSLHSG